MRIAAFLATLLGASLVVFHASAEPGWSAQEVRASVRRGAPIVVQVVVPLCDKSQIYCGPGLGNPGSLRTNLYWGALYGVPRFFQRKALGYEALEEQRAPEGVLERRAFRRMVDGAPWGSKRKVELLVVLDAIHGARIDDAVRRFYAAATGGASLTLTDRGRQRRVRVSSAGYAGHNRLMDGLKLPEPAANREGALPSFVLACYSDKYFSAALERAGATPLVTTTTYMAPEGYVVEATVRALGENLPATEVRAAAARAYAHWQRLDRASAEWIFVPR
jgi:hypothetical protein